MVLIFYYTTFRLLPQCILYKCIAPVTSCFTRKETMSGVNLGGSITMP